MLTYIIPFIILILVVVFIHEYGHYYFARKYGVGVTDFSIGFGQELFGWNDKSWYTLEDMLDPTWWLC
jgi:regulator of sigma E protease